MIMYEIKYEIEINGVPFKDKSKRSDDEKCNNMTVNRENPMAHAMFERNHGDDVHARVPKLK